MQHHRHQQRQNNLQDEVRDLLRGSHHQWCHDNLHNEVRKLLHREQDGEDGDEDHVNPQRYERLRMRDKLEEIIRLFALSITCLISEWRI